MRLAEDSIGEFKMAAPSKKHVSVQFRGDEEVLQHISNIHERKSSELSHALSYFFMQCIYLFLNDYPLKRHD